MIRKKERWNTTIHLKSFRQVDHWYHQQLDIFDKQNQTRLSLCISLYFRSKHLQLHVPWPLGLDVAFYSYHCTSENTVTTVSNSTVFSGKLNSESYFFSSGRDCHCNFWTAVYDLHLSVMDYICDIKWNILFQKMELTRMFGLISVRSCYQSTTRHGVWSSCCASPDLSTGSQTPGNIVMTNMEHCMY